MKLLKRSSGSGDDPPVKEAGEATGICGGAVKTGSETLDAILADKGLFYKENGIVLSCIADGSKLSFMDASDIYALFSNAFDNAAKAVMELKNENERRISLYIKAAGEILSVHVANRYEENGPPRTAQGRKSRRRGRGMKSIMRVVRKYGGAIAVSADKGMFFLNIILPLRDSGMSGHRKLSSCPSRYKQKKRK